MTLTVVSGPASPIVSTADAKSHLRVDASDEDAKIAALVAAITTQLEAACQRRFITQTLDWSLNGWPSVLRIPVAPVASVTSIKYRDSSNVEQTLAASSYVVYGVGQATHIRPIDGSTWPTLSFDAVAPVVVRFVAGAAAASSQVQQATIAYLHGLFDNPTLEGVVMADSGLPMVVEALIAAERWD